ncbi:hypothetical protein CORC01_05296 [Colletotrichum orchidophilum]|uniref:Uncharacterized protein n=1 Tax=Colletotrichum orchidophilum TaxID=1209926 RepID=A0A1G4BDS1_9PEZI|nr:uncharacterized protein CORC01_05296 [Colletotrichum orchidophilum]OHE99496.1 hypothetical protein CORC01_05296 [Colletotrichum orchidophilum]
MRLINVQTGCLEEFFHELPPYAVLSHTWGPDKDEITFRDIEDGYERKSGMGQSKFDGCCRQSSQDGLKYAWIDTCCIDKANSTELSEAINSMFEWYRNATVCYAFLAHVSYQDDISSSASEFRNSRWFERGWTLQELLAPRDLRFYSNDWKYLGTKQQLSSVIEKITGIPRPFLFGIAELSQASVAQRMSWAANRVTKRREDIAYCLLGIFGVSMPMIYGEGDQAFGRLQEEIMRRNTNDSILAWNLSNTELDWGSQGPTKAVSGGILATSPSAFANSGDIVCREHRSSSIDPLYVFGGHLRMHLRIYNTETKEAFGLLDCHPKDDSRTAVGIPLRQVMLDDASDEVIGQTGVEMIEVAPRDRWERDNATITTTVDFELDVTQRTWLRFRSKKKVCHDFIVLLELEVLQSRVQARCHVMTAARGTGLDAINSKIFDTNQHTFGKRSASNGMSHLEFAMDQERVGATPMFVVRLKSLFAPPPITVDAILELGQLERQQYLRDLLEEDRLIGPQRATLKAQIQSKSASAGATGQKLAIIQEQLDKLEREKMILRGFLLDTSREVEQLKTKDRGLKQQRDALSHALTISQKYRGSDVETEDQEGNSLLALASARGYEELVQMLLEREADLESSNDYGAGIEAKDNKGETSLSIAVQKGCQKAAKLLILREASIETTDSNGTSPKEHALKTSRVGMAQLFRRSRDESSMESLNSGRRLFWRRREQ